MAFCYPKHVPIHALEQLTLKQFSGETSPLGYFS